MARSTVEIAVQRENAIFALIEAQSKMAEATTKEQVLAIMKEAGKAATYTPTFRCLVMGMSPEESIKWGR